MSVELRSMILAAVQAGESTDWEFKSAKGGFPGSFWETYSAMANSEGGVVVLGVSEKARKVLPDGLNPVQAAAYQKTLWDGLSNRQLVSANLLEQNHVQQLEVGEVTLLAVQIPRATRTQRPVYLRGNPLGNTYRRKHEGDYRCTDVEVRRMLADADPAPADHRVLPGFNLDDLDRASLSQYRQRFRAAKGDHPWLALEDRDLLEKLGGWRRSRGSSEEGLTLAGLLMFGKDLLIRDPEAAPKYFVDYRENLDPSTRWTDRIYPDGTWEANLFQFFSRVWPRLSQVLPRPFQLEGGVRIDETPAHEALREAFVNALIHADYAASGGVVVERLPEKLVIENAGTLLVSLEQYWQGGVSECRNKSLQKMFLLMGGGEQAGSGADKIWQGWRAQRWRAPLLELRSQPDRVRLTLPMASLMPKPQTDFFHEPRGDSGHKPGDSSPKEGSSSHKPGGDSSHRLPDSDRSEVAVPPEQLRFEDLIGLVAPVAGRLRVSPEVLRTAILKLCAGRYLTAGQLAGLLERRADNLRSRHLAPMIDQGLLRLQYPDSPNRPDQAYTAVQQQRGVLRT